MLWLAQHKNCSSVSGKCIDQKRGKRRWSKCSRRQFQLGFKAGFCEAIMGDIPGLGAACARSTSIWEL